MDEQCARALLELNNRFYRDHAASFSDTRSGAWPGWEHVAARAQAGLSAGQELDVLDVACGNQRFLRFLAQALPMLFAYTGVDDCDPLMATVPPLAPTGQPVAVTTHHVDILAALLDGRDPFAALGRFDLVGCFGFLHHVPSRALREALLASLVTHTAPGGLIALSCWRFMDDARLAAKASTADRIALETPPWPDFTPAALDPGDHFLGWQEDAGPLRYCHHVSEDELTDLVRALSPADVEECERFSADGKTGSLNRYLVLRRR